MTKTREIIGYQMLTQSQVMHYNEMDVPEAKFSYDLSPMAVNASAEIVQITPFINLAAIWFGSQVLVSSKGRRWYDFVTSVCAIIGGTFTVVGLIDAVLHKIIKGGKQL